MSFRTSADYGPFYAGSTDFSEICVNLRFSLSLPRSRLEGLTNTLSREYIPQWGFEGFRSFLASWLWLFAVVRGKLLPKDTQGLKESLRSAPLKRDRPEPMLQDQCLWRIAPSRCRTKPVKLRHLLPMTRDTFARRCRQVTIRYYLREGNPVSAASGLSRSTLFPAR